MQTQEKKPIATTARLQSIVDYGITLGAKAIHLEPRKGSMAIRYRVNGSLKEERHLSLSEYNALIAQIVQPENNRTCQCPARNFPSLFQEKRLQGIRYCASHFGGRKSSFAYSAHQSKAANTCVSWFLGAKLKDYSANALSSPGSYYC
jgi:hypothetical protein